MQQGRISKSQTSVKFDPWIVLFKLLYQAMVVKNAIFTVWNKDQTQISLCNEQTGWDASGDYRGSQTDSR